MVNGIYSRSIVQKVPIAFQRTSVWGAGRTFATFCARWWSTFEGGRRLTQEGG